VANRKHGGTAAEKNEVDRAAAGVRRAIGRSLPSSATKLLSRFTARLRLWSRSVLLPLSPWRRRCLVPLQSGTARRS
jgi:hypothetical protein